MSVKLDQSNKMKFLPSYQHIIAVYYFHLDKDYVLKWINDLPSGECQLLALNILRCLEEFIMESGYNPHICSEKCPFYFN